MNLYPFIEAEKTEQHTVRKACVMLEVSRAAYYQWSKHTPSSRALANQTLTAHVVRIHEDSRGTYGVPRVLAQLRRDGIRTGPRRVARLMRERGLVGRGRRRSRRTTIADSEARTVPPDLLRREFAPRQRALNAAWVGDITYVRTWEGWLYLASVIDLASRRVVGWAMADHMRASLVCDALRMAIAARSPAPGLIFHSDRGSQYTSADFQQLLASHEIRQSLSRPRQCWDNAVAESWFATLKLELIYREPLPTQAHARLAIFDFIEVFYNRRRLHSSLDYATPVEYELRKVGQPTPAQAA
jgi:transposase InsO family protein